MVIACEARSGVPVHRASSKAVDEYWRTRRDAVGEWKHGLTDALGALTIQGLSRGSYRLVAQSWPGVDSIKDIGDLHGVEVVARGVVPNVEVPSEESQSLIIRPLGTGTLEYTGTSGNNDTYLFIGLAPPMGDAILGPVAWKGRFLRHAVAFNRMPKGRTTVHGLPAGPAYYVLFANDNNPGFGSDVADIRENETTRTRTDLVASWSDARHDPPDRLKPLFEEIKALREERGPGVLIEILLGDRAPDLADKINHENWLELAGPLDRQVTLPGGAEASVADLVAAEHYLRLQDYLQRLRAPAQP